MAHTGAAGVPAGGAGLASRSVLRFAIAGLAVLHAASLSSDPATEFSRAAAWAARAFLDAHTRAALERTLALALLKLDSPKCQEVFREFRDATARTLEERLTAAGRDRRALLEGISYRDGSGFSACRDTHVLAWTHPGHTVIYLCSEQFSRSAFANREMTANILIHEGLHCLGLGENPPASGVITAEVASHCRVSDSSRSGCAEAGVRCEEVPTSFASGRPGPDGGLP